MDWEKKFSSIIKDTEANLSRMKVGNCKKLSKPLKETKRFEDHVLDCTLRVYT